MTLKEQAKALNWATLVLQHCVDEEEPTEAVKQLILQAQQTIKNVRDEIRKGIK